MQNTQRLVTNPLTKQKVSLKKIFDEVDASNQRFERYTPDERARFRKEGKAFISRARAKALAEQIWQVELSEE
jgi:hypothetical protein